MNNVEEANVHPEIVCTATPGMNVYTLKWFG